MGPMTVIVVLAGGFKRDKDGVWHSSDFDGSDCGPPVSHIRLLAARYLYEEDPTRRILVVGGRGVCLSLLENDITLSTVMRRELVESGVPESAISEESLSNNTYQNIEHLLPFLRQHEVRELLIVSSEYHVPRIETLLEHVPAFAEIQKIAKVVSADNVVSSKDSLLAARVRETYTREPFPSILAKEVEGVEQIRRGTYRLG